MRKEPDIGCLQTKERVKYITKDQKTTKKKKVYSNVNDSCYEERRFHSVSVRRFSVSLEEVERGVWKRKYFATHL